MPWKAGASKENSVILKYFTAAVQKKFMGTKVGDVVTVQLSKAFDDDKLPSILEDLGFDKDDKEAAKKIFQPGHHQDRAGGKRELNEDFSKRSIPVKKSKQRKN